MIANPLRRDRRLAPAAALACALAALVTGAAENAAASSKGTQNTLPQPTPLVRKVGLLPPVIVLFEDQAAAGVEPLPDVEGSSAAAEAVGAAFVAEMAAKKIALTAIGQDELGPVDMSRLYGVASRIARGDLQPVPEALLSAEYPFASLPKVTERHQLEAVWVVTGIAILSKGSAGPPGPVTSPTGTPGAGKRLLLRAALVDREWKVLFSDIVDEGAIAPGESTPGAPAEIGSLLVDLRDRQIARHQAGVLLAEYRTEQEKREAEEAAARAQEVMAATPRSPHPAEFRLGVGVFFFASDGVDLQAAFLPSNSRWQFGYRYVRWTDAFDDPYTDNELTKTTETEHGPQVNYLFRPEKRGTWYVGASLLRWTRTESATMNGVSDSDSVVAPFAGGGYTRRLGKHFYFNLAMFLSPGTQLETDTGVSSEESSGGFDIQLQLGTSF